MTVEEPWIMLGCSVFNSLCLPGMGCKLMDNIILKTICLLSIGCSKHFLLSSRIKNEKLQLLYVDTKSDYAGNEFLNIIYFYMKQD